MTSCVFKETQLAKLNYVHEAGESTTHPVKNKSKVKHLEEWQYFWNIKSNLNQNKDEYVSRLAFSNSFMEGNDSTCVYITENQLV